MIDVGIAIVHRKDRWLVARRPDHVHLGGLWEFPGGKCEVDEHPTQAALRELLEECDVAAKIVAVLEPVSQEYEDRRVRVTPVLCEWVAGEGRPIGNVECRWVDSCELQELPMPAMNERIIRQALRSMHFFDRNGSKT